MPDPITITIDDATIPVKPGQTILQAAMDAGIYIPYLCYFPKMKPYGACRTCVVETEVKVKRKVKVKKGDQEVEEEQESVMKATVASCTAPPSPGMVVRTKTEPIKELRKGIVELLMAEHPHGCLTCHRIELCGPQDICQRHVSVTDRCTICPKNERCELKDTVRSVELDLRTPLNYHRRNLPVHTDDPFYDRDYNLCIVCARCVRVCEEVRFDTALTLTNRSGVSLVGTVKGTSLLESGCEFCGACVDVCPVGALVERDYKWEKAARKVATICTNCPVGCQMITEVNRLDKVIRFVGDLASEANNGQACFKGKFGYDYPNSSKRLKYPYVRENGVLKRVTWEDAVDRIATKLRGFSPQQLAVIASPRSTNEDAFVAAKFARQVLRTPNIDSGLNLVPEMMTELSRRLGSGGATNPLIQLERARCVLVVSGNPTEEQNVLAVYAKKAARAGAGVIVIDPRETELTRYATVWLRVSPGTELIALRALTQVILEEGLENKEFIAQRVEGLDEFRARAPGMTVNAVAALCGVSEDQLRKAARIFARAGASATLLGVDTVAPELHGVVAGAVVNLALLTGNVGRENAGIYPLYQGANTLGAISMGCARGERGVGVTGLSSAIKQGSVNAAIVMADGLNTSSGELGGLTEALGRLDFLVVSAVFDSEVTASADVVLPAAPFTEQDGTVTNVERRVQRIRRISKPKNEERSGWEMLSATAAAMGSQEFGYKSSVEVMAEIARDVPAFSGITYERLEKATVQVPCGPDAAGTPVIGLKAVDIKYRLIANDSEAASPSRLSSGLTLVQGRVLQQPVREAGISKTGNKNRIARTEIISIHLDDALEAGLIDGDPVEVRDSGTAEDVVFTGIVRLNGTVQGVVTTTTLFGEVASAMEDDPRADPSPYVSRLPLRKVRLKKARTAAATAAAVR